MKDRATTGQTPGTVVRRRARLLSRAMILSSSSIASVAAQSALWIGLYMSSIKLMATSLCPASGERPPQIYHVVRCASLRCPLWAGYANVPAPLRRISCGPLRGMLVRKTDRKPERYRLRCFQRVVQGGPSRIRTIDRSLYRRSSENRALNSTRTVADLRIRTQSMSPPHCFRKCLPAFKHSNPAVWRLGVLHAQERVFCFLPWQNPVGQVVEDNVSGVGA